MIGQPRHARPGTFAPFLAGGCSAIVACGLVAALTGLRGSAASLSAALLPAIGLLTLLPIAFNIRFLGLPLVSATNLYLLLVWCFHMGLMLPASLGLSTQPLESLGDPEALMLGALCTLLAFVAFQAGVCLTQFARLRRTEVKTPPRDDAQRGRRLFGCGMAATALLVLAALWDLRGVGIGHFLAQAYNSDLYQTADLRIYKTALAMTGTMLLVALAGSSTPAERRSVLAAAGVLVTYLALVGDRGNAFVFALSFGFVWRSIGHGIRRRTVVAAVVCCAIAAPTIRLVRSFEAQDRSIVAALQEADYLSTLEEMGGSFRTLAGTVTLVPEEHPYRLGASYVAAASYVVPNLGSQLGRGFRDLDHLDPALWITAILEPRTYVAGGGLGYSAIAEPYLNFGPLGVALFFVLAGALLAAGDVRIPGAASRTAIAARVVVLYPLLITARNDMTNFVRPAVWGLLIVACICCLPIASRPVVRMRTSVREQLA